MGRTEPVCRGRTKPASRTEPVYRGTTEIASRTEPVCREKTESGKKRVTRVAHGPHSAAIVSKKQSHGEIDQISPWLFLRK